MKAGISTPSGKAARYRLAAEERAHGRREQKHFGFPFEVDAAFARDFIRNR